LLILTKQVQAGWSKDREGFKAAPAVSTRPYLIAPRVINQLMTAGVERLPSVDGIQDYFVSNDNL